MNRDELEQQIGIMSQRLGFLLAQVQADQPPQVDLLSEALEELNMTLEELSVAQEELCQVNMS